MDILVDARTGTHYFVDLNYLPNYGDIAHSELRTAFEKLVREREATRGDDVGWSSANKVAFAAVVSLVGATALWMLKRRQ